MDGISQPLIEGLDTREPQGKEPKAVKPGYENPLLFLQQSSLVTTTYTNSYFRLILCNHPGDINKQPDWAKDGSFLVIRDLQQLVPEFDR